MYNQSFKNQAVKEVKNGSTVASVARKFNIAQNTLNSWIGRYEEKMYGIIKGKSPGIDPVESPRIAPVESPSRINIKLQSVKVSIDGAVVTLKRNDVLKMLNLFNIFDERIEGE